MRPGSLSGAAVAAAPWPTLRREQRDRNAAVEVAGPTGRQLPAARSHFGAAGRGSALACRPRERSQADLLPGRVSARPGGRRAAAEGWTGVSGTPHPAVALRRGRRKRAERHVARRSGGRKRRGGRTSVRKRRSGRRSRSRDRRADAGADVALHLGGGRRPGRRGSSSSGPAAGEPRGRRGFGPRAGAATAAVEVAARRVCRKVSGSRASARWSGADRQARRPKERWPRWKPRTDLGPGGVEAVGTGVAGPASRLVPGSRPCFGTEADRREAARRPTVRTTR
jgi:hypothetical protein